MAAVAPPPSQASVSSTQKEQEPSCVKRITFDAEGGLYTIQVPSTLSVSNITDGLFSVVHIPKNELVLVQDGKGIHSVCLVLCAHINIV